MQRKATVLIFCWPTCAFILLAYLTNIGEEIASEKAKENTIGSDERLGKPHAV